MKLQTKYNLCIAATCLIQLLVSIWGWPFLHSYFQLTWDNWQRLPFLFTAGCHMVFSFILFISSLEPIFPNDFPPTSKSK